VINLEQNKVLSVWGTQEKGQAIDVLCWGPSYPENDNEIVLARQDGVIQYWDIRRGLILAEHPPVKPQLELKPKGEKCPKKQTKNLPKNTQPPSETRIHGLEILNRGTPE
jgi:hypothetical protein